jgi:transketolase
MRKTFIDTLTELSQDDLDIYIVSGDAGYGVFEKFREMYPQRFINAGVAEANMIGFSAGMALAGFNVFVYNIIPFVLYRCYEQVRNDICYQNLPVTLIGTGSGLTYAPQGMTHYAVEDLAICATLPNLTVISPIDPIETRAAVKFAVKSKAPVYIRLAVTGEPQCRAGECSDIFSPAIIREGEDAVVLSYGTVFREALEACEKLAAKGIHIRLVSVPVLQPFPGEAVLQLINGFKTVVTLEEHFRNGGLASRLVECLVEHRLSVNFVPLALPNSFIHDVKKQAGMRRHYGIDADAVMRAVTESSKTSV